jgi:hypothetical protein
MPRAAWIAAVVCLAAGSAAPVVAQPLAPVGGPPLTSTPVAPARSTERPPPVLGAPVGLATPGPTPLTPAGFVDMPAERKPQRAAAFGAPSAAGGPGASGVGTPAAPVAPVSAALVDDGLNRTNSPSAADPVNDFLTKRSDLRSEQKDRDPAGGRTSASKGSVGWPKFDLSHSKYGEMGDRLEGVFGARNGDWFRSDHLFDGFISPVSNPFLFEDPRSLTELRPIFIYQGIPGRQPDFQGGHISYFGTQARVAFTDRWSLVVNKFGGIAVSPSNNSVFDSKTGFAEIWLGPKFTFYRGEETGSIAATGLQFQLPVGSQTAFQNTGTLSLVPYLSYGQNFLRDFRLGSFNFLASTGYAFSVNQQRSDYYYLSAHLDFDAGNLHRFYPLMELNWIVNTTRGNSVPIGAEGRDLVNFGGQAAGSGLLTMALGGRVKISECAQIGAAFEFPLAGRKDFFQYRFTLDFILRY